MRENPKQDRAVKTVDLISEATIQVLDNVHEPKFTTNHIAARAGISIGTLYRYFPDKGAIFRFVVKREIRRTSDKVLDVIDTSRANNASTLLNEVVVASMSAFSNRSRATHIIRELAQQDEQLVSEMTQLRLTITRCLHDRLRQLEPTRFKPVSDTELQACGEAFKAAILTLGRNSPDRKIDETTRANLIAALLAAFSIRQ